MAERNLLRQTDFLARVEVAETYVEAAAKVNSLGEARQFEVDVTVTPDVHVYETRGRARRYVATVVNLAFWSPDLYEPGKTPSWAECRRQLDETMQELQNPI